MSFDAGAVQGRLELAIEGWKHSVEMVKTDLAAMAKESGLSTAQFSSLKGVISGLGISLKSELEAKLKAAEAALITFKNSGQLTAEGQKKLEENITKLKNELAGMTGETGKADKAHESLWKQFAIGQIVVDLARKAFSLAKDVIKDSIAEAAAYEKALATLDATFTASGRNMPGMTTRLKEYAKEIEGLGMADETTALQSEALLLRMTNLNEKGIKEATRLAVGLAYVYGIDLNTATEIVGKGMEGVYRGFTTLAPQIVKATTDADKHAAMMKFLNDTYIAAQAQTKTYSGEVKTLGLAWGETKKSFGEAILNTEILQKSVQMMTDILNGEAGKHATDIFIFISAATKACVREVLPFLESLQFMKPTLAEARKAALQGRDAWDSYKEGLKNNDEYLIKNKDSIIAWMQKGLESIGLLDKQKKKINETGDGVNLYTQKLEALKKELNLTFTTDIQKKIDDIQLVLKIFGNALPTTELKRLNEELNKLKTILTGTLPGARDFSKLMADMIPEFKDAHYWGEQYDQIIEKLGLVSIVGAKEQTRLYLQEQKLLNEAWQKGLISNIEYVKGMSDLQDKMRGISETAKTVTDVWKDMNEQIAADFIRAVGSILTGQKSILDGFTGILDSIVSLWIDGMTKIVKAGMDAGKSIGDIFSDMASSAATPLAIIAIMFTNWIKGMKASAEDFKKHEEALWKVLYDDVKSYYEFLGKISDATSEKLFKLEKEFGKAGAEARALADMMHDTGITVENFDNYLGKATNTLTLMEKGLLDVKTGTALADEQFSMLLEAAKKFGEEGSAAMVNFIITARQMGLEIESVTKYVQGELDKIPASLTVMIGAAGDSADALKGMGDIALLTFNSMLASGVSWTDAVFKMGDPLKALAQRYVDLGLTADPALAELMKIVGVTEAHKGLFDALSANDQVLKALGNSGWLTADALKVLTKNANDYYNELIATGLTADQALAAMGPTLQDIYDYSKAYGFTLDENTQKLIDEAKAAGKVKDKVDIAEVLVGVEKVLGRLADIFDRMYGKASDTKKVLDAINGTNYSYNMKENWTSNKPEQDNEGEETEEYQHGGYVPETGLALLHAGEYVIPPGIAPGFVNAAAPSMAISGAGPIINNYINFNIEAIDGPSVERIVKGPVCDILDDVYRQNKKGLTSNLNKYLKAMA